MFLDEVEGRVSRDVANNVIDWRGLQVATYDERTQRLVYAQPRRLVVNKATRRGVELVELTQRDSHWHNGITTSDDGVSIMCTPNHMLYVKRDDDTFVKTSASDVLRNTDDDDVRLMARAVKGVTTTTSNDDELQTMMRTLGLTTTTSIRAFVTLVGCWLASGVTTNNKSSVSLMTCDATRVRALLRECGVTRAEYLERNTINIDNVTIEVKKVTWARVLCDATRVPTWALTLSTDLAAALLAGMHLTDTHRHHHHRDNNAVRVMSVRASSRRVRDDLMRIALHAGYSATFTAATDDGDDAWIITYDDESEPCIRRKGDDVMRRVQHYTGRTWCFDMNDGFVVVRRAERDVDGSVVRASRATIQGNCSEELQTHGDHHRFGGTKKRAGSHVFVDPQTDTQLEDWYV